MNSEYLLGIDTGTTGAKSGIFNLKGDIISSSYKEYLCLYPKPNWVEQDINLLFESTINSIRETILKSGINPKCIASLALSTQRTCSIFINKKGKVLRPMISWQDNRTIKEVEEIDKKIPSSQYYKITGLPNNTTWILSKILWLRKNEPKIYDKVYKVIQLQDYILKFMGVEDYFTDVPDAGLFGFWETKNLRWSKKLLDLFNIDENILPLPIPSGQKVGVISKDFASKTGLSIGTPLCMGAGDQNCAAVGAGIVFDGYLSISLGTAANIIAYLDKLLMDPHEKSMITNHAIYGKWQFEGYQAGAASIFRWFKDEIATLEKAYAEQSGKDVYKILNQLIEAESPGAKGLIFLPYLASATSPRWNPYARGTLLGLTFAHNRGCIARSIVEGITMGIKDILSSIFSSGFKINTIRIMGGATKSSLWNQIQADMYNKTIETLKVSDAALLGAAILAGVGVGSFKNIREGVEQMVYVDCKYEPVRKNSDLYDELYYIYCQIYEGLEEKSVFRSISKFQERY